MSLSEEYVDFLSQDCQLQVADSKYKTWRSVDVCHEKYPTLLGTGVKPLKIHNSKTLRLNFTWGLKSIFCKAEIPDGKMKMYCGQFPRQQTCDKHLKLAMYVYQWEFFYPHEERYKPIKITRQEWDLEGRVHDINFSLQGGIAAYCNCPFYLRLSGNVGQLRVEKTLTLVMETYSPLFRAVESKCDKERRRYLEFGII